MADPLIVLGVTMLPGAPAEIQVRPREPLRIVPEHGSPVDFPTRPAWYLDGCRWRRALVLAWPVYRHHDLGAELLSPPVLAGFRAEVLRPDSVALDRLAYERAGWVVRRLDGRPRYVFGSAEQVDATLRAWLPEVPRG